MFIVLAHWNNSPQVELSLYSEVTAWFLSNQPWFLLPPTYWRTNFIAGGLTWLGLERTIFRRRGEHDKH